MYNIHLYVWKHGNLYYIYTLSYWKSLICKTRVLSVASHMKRCANAAYVSLAKCGDAVCPGQAQIVLSLWMFEKVLGNDLPTGHTDLRVITPLLWVTYHGHLETCWACNPQYQEDSLYPHSLTKSLCDITLHDSLELPWTLVFCLYNACCM